MNGIVLAVTLHGDREPSRMFGIIEPDTLANSDARQQDREDFAFHTGSAPRRQFDRISRGRVIINDQPILKAESDSDLMSFATIAFKPPVDYPANDDD